MKLVISFFIIFFYSYGYEQQVDDKTAFEMLLFKTGVTSLSKDFEIEKENISNNRKEIENLKKEVQYLLQENMKLKLGVQDSHLEDENKMLKNQLEKLKMELTIQNTNNETKQEQKDEYLDAIVSDNLASSVLTPYPNSKKVKFYTKGDTLKIEFCNKYGWCKIVDKNEYIAQYKIYFTKGVE